ncbi:MAG TPA: T9SS type A sorting domain-containing protein [Chitinophagales bacterium]|nr:T9SS type A sorting domain-containing protein [Chitinophagales bacterium]HMU69301.1 T9SS type A sorting domain-containing protein [Chitinophagales bacterium]HNA57973.1 T9SS type A sorting domain-containing protein [Chitinophagales bacterium]HNE47181.1 T9SS type A sorting domain-containing protein [Chitinophagales bacterium]HNF68761.1 T9SS type A sorting domain-containing protein [Chitinophagales bacterium]
MANMHLKNTIQALLVAFPLAVFGQAPVIEWENTIGGNAWDGYPNAKQTPDGGYIIGGNSMSNISVDKAENNFAGSNDFWVLKLNSSGGIEWQNTIGGNGNDFPGQTIPTTDGGYMVGGHTLSGISGDKTSPGYGLYDLWLVKLNSTGGIMWQKTLGGTNDEWWSDLHQTSDGGYIVGGQSLSGLGGNKSEVSQGGFDYWVVKLNAAGGIQWQNTVGGSADDLLSSIIQTPDGGYLLGGTSSSGVSGDKTEGTMGVGYSDYWVVKLNAVGNIEWQNTIGGNLNDVLQSVDKTLDGGYILSGYSNSGISGDKTETSFSVHSMWVIKLDAGGNIVWQQTMNDAYYSEIHPTLDGGYILGAMFPYQIIKLDASGEVVWSSFYGSSCNLNDIEQTSDGGFIVSGHSYDGILVVKSEPNYGPPDFWIMKLAPDFCVPVDEVCNSTDDDCNGLIDDDVIENITITAGGPVTFCNGGFVELTATYSGTSLQWRKDGLDIPGATNANYTVTSKGTYTCQTTSVCGSAVSTGIYVQVYKNPNAFISADGPTLFCPGGSVTLTETPSGGCTYQWYKGASAIAGATSTTYIATTTGNYKCRVTKTATGCYKNSNAIAVSVTCREGELLDADNVQINVYPNPAQSTITIQSSSEIPSTIQIRDMVGQLIIPEMSLQGQLELDVTAWPAGIYFLQSTTENDIIVTQFIKQ